MKGKFMTVAALLAATAIGWHGHHGIVKNSRTKNRAKQCFFGYCTSGRHKTDSNISYRRFAADV